ncbi:hypothetical protein CCACVL1_05870 [Corchorus capsularis]|uniref:Uncharacterized protein n=1 Tax=Corchorus capsularis TaxID=210143 RepID=A0A1R3JIM5_COCAP|nr:hypothetical protein CCACVL1_05870 [Corchorus capsularis]
MEVRFGMGRLARQKDIRLVHSGKEFWSLAEMGIWSNVPSSLVNAFVTKAVDFDYKQWDSSTILVAGGLVGLAPKWGKVQSYGSSKGPSHPFVCR